jgi:CDP-glycerol glycerophosphotransferase (TagB/SpsB family)
MEVIIMAKIIYCKLCGNTLKYKGTGRPKKCCKNCVSQNKYNMHRAYRKTHYKNILLYAKKWRDANREKIREQSRQHTLLKARLRKEYNKKLLADVIAHPRKYLKKFGGNENER